MTEKQIDLIKKALFNIEMREVRYLDSFPDVDFVHTEKYIQNINKLLSGKAPKPSTAFFRKPLLAVIIAIVLLFATACTFKKTIVNFFEEIYETFTNLKTNEDYDKTITTVYTLSYLPDGYELKNETINKTFVSTLWSDGENKILLYQKPLNNGCFTIDTENNDHGYIYTEDLSVFYVRNNNTYLFTWENDYFAFQLKCNDSISLDEAKKIIENISKK